MFCFRSAISGSELIVADADAAEASPDVPLKSFPLLGNVAELSDSITMVASSRSLFNYKKKYV